MKKCLMKRKLVTYETYETAAKLFISFLEINKHSQLIKLCVLTTGPSEREMGRNLASSCQKKEVGSDKAKSKTWRYLDTEPEYDTKRFLFNFFFFCIQAGLIYYAKMPHPGQSHNVVIYMRADAKHDSRSGGCEFDLPVSLSLISFYTPNIFVHALSCRVRDFSR